MFYTYCTSCSLSSTARGRVGGNISLIWTKPIGVLSSLLWGNTDARFSCHRFTRVKELHALVFELQLQRWTTLPQHRYHLSYPKPADEQASVLQAHVALLLDDLLDILENVPGHRNIAAHVDVSSLLPQALVHPLWQLFTQRILHIFLTRRQGEMTKSRMKMKRTEDSVPCRDTGNMNKTE